MRILITGFEPFEGAPTNCTELVVRGIERLARDRGAHPVFAHDLATAVLPVADRTAGAALHAAMDRHGAELVVSLGEAAARASVGVERLAINLRDYRIADNEGAVIKESPVVADGPAAYFASLPLQTVREAFERRSIPARVSRDAGTFLCNQVMYELLHRCVLTGGEQRGGERGVRGGFIHLPLVVEQLGEIVDGRRSMPRPGPGVLDLSASDGSAAELSTNHWQRALSVSAVPLERMVLGMLDAVEAACGTV